MLMSESYSNVVQVSLIISGVLQKHQCCCSVVVHSWLCQILCLELIKPLQHHTAVEMMKSVFKLCECCVHLCTRHGSCFGHDLTNNFLSSVTYLRRSTVTHRFQVYTEELLIKKQRLSLNQGTFIFSS